MRYARKSLPTACLNHSVIELEIIGLLVNMELWKTLLKRHEFDAAVDNLAVVKILKAKTESAIPRIIRLLDQLSSYSFKLYFVNGKNMFFVDYFSRHSESDDNPCGLVPLSFCCFETYLSHLGLDTLNVYLTRSKTKEAGVIVPEVHGVNKRLVPHVMPEHQKPKTQLKPARSAPSLAQNIARMLVSKSVKTLCRLATRMEGRGSPPEGPKPQSDETDIKMPRQLPTVLGPISLPRQIPIPSKRQTPAQLYIEETIGKYTGRKALKAWLDTSIDTGNDDEILEPEIHIPTDADFVTPPF